MSISENRENFLNAIQEEIGQGNNIVSRPVVLKVAKKLHIKPPAWFINDQARRAKRGHYYIKIKENSKIVLPKVEEKMVPQMFLSSESLIPAKIPEYVPFGHYDDLNKIIKSGLFFTTYITGLSGNGKTLMVEQICANNNREMIRANITKETDEDDLIGGFRLINGETVWQDGPVVTAMKRGAILLLDEVDLGDAKLLCLQPVLEGKSIFLKKINEQIFPKAGFNVIATANTKGRGSDDGRFIGANVMNEAFLERFSITFEQEYPSIRTEEKILNNYLKSFGGSNPSFVTKIVKWADTTRKTFADGSLSDLISTRRAVKIVEAYAIFQNELKAVELCLNRFDVETKESFLSLYKKFDDSENPEKSKSKDPVYNDKFGGMPF